MRMCETALFLLPVWNMTVGTVKMVNMRHRAKFRDDRSNRCGDMAIFRFFKMAAVRHLGFTMRTFRPPTKGIWWSLFIYYGRLWNRTDHYNFSCCSLFFFFPRLISAAADWMSAILPHMVWPQCEFKMQVWNLLHAARWKHRTQKSRQKSPSGHQRTTLSGYIFATKAHIDNRRKLIKQQCVLHT